MSGNTFAVTSGSSEGIGLGIERGSADAAYSGAAAPADWADVTAEDARAVYGKSSIIVADNTFDEIFFPWQVSDGVGSDFAATGNKATMRHSASSQRLIEPSWSGAASGTTTFAIECILTKNTLTVTPSGEVGGETWAFFSLDIPKVPPASTVLFAGNDVTTGAPTSRPLLAINSLTAIPASSTYRVHRNALKAMDGAAGGAQPGVFVARHVVARLAATGGPPLLMVLRLPPAGTMTPRLPSTPMAQQRQAVHQPPPLLPLHYLTKVLRPRLAAQPLLLAAGRCAERHRKERGTSTSQKESARARGRYPRQRPSTYR